MRHLLFCVLILSSFNLSAQQRLTGTVMSYTAATDHSAKNAFDGAVDTYYSASAATGGWVGLDLGTQHVITGVGLCAAASDNQVKYGWIEGANNSNFSDALPLFMYESTPESGQMIYNDISVTRGFRYVRYMGPHGSYSDVAELEFYGIESEGQDSLFYSPLNLPTVSIYVENLAEPRSKYTELKSIISVISANGRKLVQDSGTVRLRGNFSIQMDKKPYRFKLNNKRKLLGSPAKAKKWTLVPSHGDKTLMRNWLCYDISDRIGMPYSPFCVPVNVWLNGDYKGCYQLCDQVDIRKGRINIDEMDTLCVSGDSLTGGYFIEIDAYASSEASWFRSAHSNPVTIKSPDSDDILAVQKTYITEHFNKMENELYNKNFDVETGYQKYLDQATFIKRFIHQEFVANTDTYWSVFMYKPRGDDKLYACPVWDLDLTFDNDDRTYPINQKTNWIYLSGGSNTGTMRNFVNILLSDSTFEHNMQAEWARIRCTHAIGETELLEMVDMFADSLDLSQQMNFWRWPIMNTTVHENPVIWGSYEAEVQNVKNSISGRIPWMDNMQSCTEEDYELTIQEGGWATLYIPFAAYVPDDLKAYRVTGIDDSKLILEQDTLIEANKPYLVHGEIGSHTISGFRIPDWTAQKLGQLTGTSTEIHAPVDSYVLQNQDGVAYFYRVAADKAPLIPEHKAYLTLPSEMSAAHSMYYWIDEESNGINEIMAEPWGDAGWYTLDGRKLNEKPEMKGMYLHGGKKVWIK